MELLLSLLVAALLPLSKADMSPCLDYGKGKASCSKVYIPRWLCSACSIGPYNGTGDYEDCTRTANIEGNPQCLNVLQQFVELNPCDDKRREALDTWLLDPNPDNRERGRQALDYLIYALCENGCDCIPQDHADPTQRAMDVHRGNCQAHMWYDICSIFPAIKVVQLGGSTEIPVDNLPEVCPKVARWIRTDDGRNFRERSYTPVDPDVEVFLNHLFQAQQILETDFWDQCFEMETTQSRVHVDPSVLMNTTDSFKTIRINSGVLGQAYKDQNGNVWSPDRYYRSPSNNTYLATGTIFNAKDGPLYLSERFYDGDLVYQIPVPRGKYRVTLGFAEIFFEEPGKRVFRVIVEDRTVYHNLDIVKLAGGPWLGVDLNTEVIVTDGFLTIRLKKVLENPKISTIMVELDS